MRRAALATGIVLLLAAASPAQAQFRGGLTSRPPTSTVPRSPTAPLVRTLPIWWHWGLVMLPETPALVTPLLDEGAPTGGVQLDVLPWSAQVYVDGALAGRVEDFRGYYHHLEIPGGPHVIAIVTPGYAPLVVDVVVVPGRTITYRATLR